MHISRVWLFAALAGTLGAFAAPSMAARPNLEQFDIKAEPAPQDWRFFIKAPEADRERLWLYHQKRGTELGGWAWGWRLGWVRTCAASSRPYCRALMREALFDKALVVRSEAATQLGRRFGGSGSRDVVDLLASAYANRRNLRNGKPLFVQSRILFAIRQVGGDHALTTGRRLAGSHPIARAYWEKLDAASR